VTDVFVRDLVNGNTVRASVASNGAEADRESSFPSLSHDGRVVVFVSSATNLAPGGPSRGDEFVREDVYIHDLVTGKTAHIAPAQRERVTRDYTIRPMISADAHVVVFVSDFKGLVLADTNDFRDVFAYQFSSAPWF
jgi:Tol biopolymer transport system component